MMYFHALVLDRARDYSFAEVSVTSAKKKVILCPLDLTHKKFQFLRFSSNYSLRIHDPLSWPNLTCCQVPERVQMQW